VHQHHLREDPRYHPHRGTVLCKTARGVRPGDGIGEVAGGRDGCLFTVTVHRKEDNSSEKILALLKAEPGLAAREVAERLEITQRAVEKQIAKLREDGRLRRIGPARGGHWEVLE
jgi:ATP-dependent DNA helicase RecG